MSLAPRLETDVREEINVARSVGVELKAAPERV